MASDDRWLERLRLELAWFTGQAMLRSRGAGAILRFRYVRPRRRGFQPLREHEITPQFLDRAIRALKRWNYDFLGMDEVCRRAVMLPEKRRFVALTFDGAGKDLITFAYPVLARHAVPFTIYVPTAFPDGVGEAWWLALEQVIARESRIDLMMGDKEQRFTVADKAGKQALFSHLESWLRSLPPADLSAAIADLCTRYRIDLAALSREASMDWEDLARLAGDPLVTIGSATVNYPMLANMKDAAALREMTMGKAVAESAFNREIRHFAYPFGDRASFRRSHVVMAEQAGFASAASTIPGIVEAEGRTNLRALPRISWDGRVRSLRMLRVLVSGAAFAPVRPTGSATSQT
ncbi:MULTISPECIES: polysaccharide deacetylase family protein [Bradyrhizobium]|uniref:polysaccharide deacetylase family protein n=1 Tax=Bradyrhizobium TaxID=374 RepID=UPI001CD50A48|nr:MULTISPECIES: polysaccharide deacetylase family protein [Bradyrhizobium]MCA1376198.1 polysaccharide deacetylase family protein [Bradyrhizobium sp. IC4060]MCA1434456.1 polysaccharide deacetylase family protein [Bradyrhizobium sp. BRP20]MCA1482924.1 polysaccharide deacetylase family protein [Bradyrhizobium sp. IC4061]MCA1497686.1 polysaccharide deacetylase family protein [Bradyrhizobium sp. NBAIM14]MCA1513351.1 polysaccharide deacetylase family protein [Bradyrhizobium sp. NBAIM01]